MSEEFAKIYGSKEWTREDVKKSVQHKGRKNEDGTPAYVTEQNHAKTCDVNNVIKRFKRSGVIDHLTSVEATFGDATSVDYKEALDIIQKADVEFMKLPSEIRAKFNNDPGAMLDFTGDVRLVGDMVEDTPIIDAIPEAPQEPETPAE